MFSAEILREVDETVAQYPDAGSALLPLLHLVQREKGWISPDSERWVAERLGHTPAMVHGVVTFYSMYYIRPMGRFVIQLCRTLSCELRGALDLRRHLQEKLGIAPGETTADGRFSLVEVECLGACGTAPALFINNDFHENLDIAAVDRILDSLANSAGIEPEIPRDSAGAKEGEHGSL